MLTLDLVRLFRERGPVHLREEVPREAELFEGIDLPLSTDLTVDVKVTPLPSGELVVRGSLGGTLTRDCRRCLEPVDVYFDQELDLLFVPQDAFEEGMEDDEGVHGFDPASGTLDLGEAIREETILAAPLYVECSPDCRGLCPRCGKNLNEEQCDCTRTERDPRWDALRKLKTE